MIYFIQAGENGPIKIGASTDPDQRLRSIDGMSPVPVKMIGLFEGGYVAEAFVQATLAKYRTRFEWFLPDPVVMDFIAAAVNADAIPNCPSEHPEGRRSQIKKMPEILALLGLTQEEMAAGMGVSPMCLYGLLGLRSIGRVVHFARSIGLNLNTPDFVAS